MNELIYLSGAEIPFPQASIIIHQPTIKEISMIGEDRFFMGLEILNLSKDIFEDKDKALIEDQSNFKILMAIITDDSRKELQDAIINFFTMLFLILPQYTISIDNQGLVLTHNESNEISKITEKNFEAFKRIVSEMSCWGALQGNGETSYDPQDALAERIAKKLKKRHQKIAQLNNASKVAVLSRYVSILAVGLQKDINALMSYTMYQLFDEFKRFSLKMAYDMSIQAKLAGAKGLEEVEDWMKDIHS